MEINRINCSGSKAVFTGKPLDSMSKQIVDLLYNKKAIDALNRFKKFNGEGGGILINSVGTGAIAPLFIAFNPLVKSPKDATAEQKQDIENTKKYTAMRQPISAILAILIQFGIQKPLDIALDSLFNNPVTAKHLWIGLDQSTLNNDGYIERKVKSEIKKEKLNFSDKKAFEAEVANRVEKFRNKQINDIAEHLKRNSQIKIGERIIPDKDVANVINKQIDKYLEDVRSLIIGEKGLTFYTERAEMLMKNKEELINILSNIPSKPENIDDYLKSAINKTANNDVKYLLKEILDYPDSLLKESRCTRTVERIHRISHACNNNYSPKAYMDSMLDDNAELNKLIVKLQHGKIKDIENADKNTIRNAIDNLVDTCKYNKENKSLNKIFRNIDTFLTDRNQLVEKIHKDIAKGYKEVLKNRYKGFNQLAKIVIGASIMVPITCTALNWVYPRFMDIFFPKLSGTKKGGDK